MSKTRETIIRGTMTSEQILLERKLTCEAIDGAMAFGYQNTNPPPSDDHWLAPFWKIGRKQAELESAATAPVIADTAGAKPVAQWQSRPRKGNHEWINLDEADAKRIAEKHSDIYEVRALCLASPAIDAAPKLAQPISDAMMDLADRLGSEADAVDPRAWKHLLVYAPGQKDGKRYRWLTEDHHDAETRRQCRSIIDSMGVRSYSATSRDIDAAIEKESK